MNYLYKILLIVYPTEESHLNTRTNWPRNWTIVGGKFLRIIYRWVWELEKPTQMTVANKRSNFEITFWFNMTRFQNGKDAWI